MTDTLEKLNNKREKLIEELQALQMENELTPEQNIRVGTLIQSISNFDTTVMMSQLLKQSGHIRDKRIYG